MSGGRRLLRLLEWSCAVVADLYTTLLVLFTNYDALLISYRNGHLASTITVLRSGVCRLAGAARGARPWSSATSSRSSTAGDAG